MKQEIEFIKKNIKNVSVVVVACSGGPDSMCLLDLVNKVKLEKKLKIIVAHVNHKVRIESDEEAKMVEAFCQKNDIIFELLELSEFKNGKFSEEIARNKRYQFFDKVIAKYQANYLLTAHHGDDLIETILMRITRGSTLSGFIGIRDISTNDKYSILRPLLTTTKEEIYAYLKENHIPYAIDKSNESLKYTRNRYRKEVLPFLKKEEKNIHKKYLKFSKELQEYEEFVNKYITDQKIIVDNSIVINKIKKENNFIKRKVIELLIKDIQSQDILDISDKQIEQIISLIDKSNKSINLKNNYQAINSYGKLYIHKIKPIFLEKEILDRDLTTNYFNFYYNRKDEDFTNNCIYLLSSEINLPLYIRSRENGDKIAVKNLKGTKKVNDIFIDSKIPKQKRDAYPIVVDAKNTVLWIPGLKKSKFAKEKSEKYDIIIKCEAR